MLPAQHARPSSGTSAPEPAESVDSLAAGPSGRTGKDPGPGLPAATREWGSCLGSALSLHFLWGERTLPPHQDPPPPGPTRLPSPRTEAFGPSDPDPTQPSVFLCLRGRGGRDAVWFNVLFLIA